MLTLVFDKSVESERNRIGEQLSKDLIGFQVGIALDSKINICKLITDKEIEAHQHFFEQCAKDYRVLATSLFYALIEKLKIQVNEDFPLLTFNPLKIGGKSNGEVNGWFYYLHGFDCGFKNKKTKQYIEVSLISGKEFGTLDPYFFTQYIKSTKSYLPLPVGIYENYADGKRIIEKMTELGKFETINSNMSHITKAVVADRDKIEVKEFSQPFAAEKREKFNFWRTLWRK